MHQCILHGEDSHLMAHSREQLTMDMTKSENSIFQQSGCFVSRSKAFGFLCLTIILAVLVGFITYHATSKCDTALTDGSTSLEIPSVEHGAVEDKVRDVRLPTNLRPLYYKVDLIPHVEEEKNFTIDGKVAIDILVLKDTNRISL
ncbi:unnamed protein product, partial [Allacma fusca]